MEVNITMGLQKEQKLSIDLSNRPKITVNTSDDVGAAQGSITEISTLFSVRSNLDMSLNKEFHFREVVSYIISRMNLEFDKSYKLKDVIDNILESGNRIESVKQKYFDSDLYLGIRGQITTDFRKHVLLNILEEDNSKRESFGYILDSLNDDIIIRGADLTSHISISESEYHLKLYGPESFPIIVINIPY